MLKNTPLFRPFFTFQTLSSEDKETITRNGLKLHSNMYPRGGYYHNEGITIWIFGGGTVGQNVPFLARFDVFPNLRSKNKKSASRN